MYKILKRLSDEMIKGVGEAGRKSAGRFVDKEFLDSFEGTVLSSLLFESEDTNPLLCFAIYSCNCYISTIEATPSHFLPRAVQIATPPHLCDDSICR